MKKLFITLLFVMGIVVGAQAAYLRNVPQTIIQPNGDTLHCFATGDEYYHWLHDANGYTIVLNAETGFFVYADRVGDALVPTSYVAGQVNPASVGLVPELNISASQKIAKRQAWEQSVPQRDRSERMSNFGLLNNIVIFIRFADDAAFTNSYSAVESMFNAVEPGAVSMHNYFQSASYGQLTIESYFYPAPNGDNILSYQDTYNRSYFEPQSSTNPDGYTEDERTAREFALLKRAVDAIAPLIPANIDFDNDNDGYIDNVCFVVRGDVGGWSDLLWPHRWSLYNENAQINGSRVWDFNFQLADATSYFNVSTLCHEMNHSLGAPDLYHYYDGTDMSPVGCWDLMEQNANPPQHMGAYMKYKYGQWIDNIPEITTCGTYSLHALGVSDTNNCYKIASSNPDEYFVLEYRNNSNTFETALPGSGLLIYRINTNFEGNASYNGTSIFDEVYLYRPDGTPTTDGSIRQAHFSVSTGRPEFNENTNPTPFFTDGTLSDLYIHSITEAGGETISFTYCSVNYMSVTPSSITILNQEDATATFNIVSDMQWTISNSCDWLTLNVTSGEGNAVVTVTAVSDNNTFESRSCTITITAENGTQEQVVVTQPGITPYLSVQETTAAVSANATDTAYVNISCNHSWTVSADCEWLQIIPQSGTGNAVVAIYATSANADCTPRTCMLTFIGETSISDYVTVTQTGVIPELNAAPISYLFENDINEQATLTITSNTSWTITGNGSWLALSQTQGTGNATITMTTREYNDLTDVRVDTLLIATSCNYSTEVRVSQVGLYLYTSETAIMLDAPVQSFDTLTVFSNRSWQITNIPSWLSVNPSNGTGEIDITLTATSTNDDLIERAAILHVTAGDISEDLLVYQNSIHTAIADFSDVDFNFYPNPASDFITVVKPTDELCHYNLIDITGKTIVSGSLTERITQVNLGDITSGIYFIRICDQSGKTWIKKVVKK